MSFEFAPLDDPQSCPKLPSFPIELAKVLIDRLNPQDFEGYELDPLSFKAVVKPLF
jgi:hypothetical protein